MIKSTVLYFAVCWRTYYNTILYYIVLYYTTLISISSFQLEFIFSYKKPSRKENVLKFEHFFQIIQSNFYCRP